jgi:integrase
MAKEVRGPVEQLLSVVLAGFVPGSRQRRNEPFDDTVPGFFTYLSDERVDADRQLLTVRGGKFGKSRLVPHGPRIGALLDRQLERRRLQGATEPAAALFTFDNRRCVHPRSASATFHRLTVDLGFTISDGVSSPRLHSLRHSFAVGCLLRWYRDGMDPATRLLQLSTFMGHVDPSSTAVYLTITPQLLTEANRRFEAFAAPASEPVTR